MTLLSVTPSPITLLQLGTVWTSEQTADVMLGIVLDSIPEWVDSTWLDLLVPPDGRASETLSMWFAYRFLQLYAERIRKAKEIGSPEQCRHFDLHVARIMDERYAALQAAAAPGGSA